MAVLPAVKKGTQSRCRQDDVVIGDALLADRLGEPLSKHHVCDDSQRRLRAMEVMRRKQITAAYSDASDGDGTDSFHRESSDQRDETAGGRTDQEGQMQHQSSRRQHTYNRTIDGRCMVTNLS